LGTLANYEEFKKQSMTAIEFLHFEVAQSSMDIMAASAENMAASSDNMAASVTILGGHSNLKRQKFIQK
jgi:hypothetical protein